MGEKVQEEKKPEVVEEKKEEEVAAKPAGDEKKPEETPPPPPPPPPPQEIVLRVFMHCEGCARKVRRCLRGFEGVEDVITDCKTHKVVVKGEKADPLKVLERVQKKSHRQVELLSPIPKPPAAEEPEPPKEKEAPKPEEKKEEPPQVITVVLQVNMHCEACAQEIRKRILRMKGVESVEPDLKQSQVSVKGTFEAPQLVDFVHKRTGKRAIILKQDPEPKKEEAAAAEAAADDNKGKEEKKEDAGAADKKAEATKPEAEAAAGDGKEKEKEGEKKDGAGGGDGGAAAGGGDGGEGSGGGGGDETKVVEVRRNEFYYYHPQNYQIYPPRYTAETAYGYPPAPQMFSDENPNACSVM